MKWTIKEDQVLVDLYSTTKIKDLMPLLPERTWQAINRRAQRLGLKNENTVRYKYTANHDFFVYPSLLNSYWAGFIAADGCIHPDRNWLEISIQKSDQEHLGLFLEHIEADHPVRCYDFDKYSIARVDVFSEQIVADLEANFGICSRKSLTLSPPRLEGDFAVAFLAGYLDGDGCVHVKNDKYLSLQFTGTKKMLEWIRSICLSVCSPPQHCRISSVRLTNDPLATPEGALITSTYAIVGSQAVGVMNKILSLDIPMLARKRKVIDRVLSYERN